MRQEYSSHINELKRLQIAGLFTLSFIGSIMHTIIHNLLSHGMDPKVIAETAEMMKQPIMQIMFFVFTVLGVAPAFMAFVFKGKTCWRILTILAMILLAVNGMHYINHMLKADVMNGGITLVLQIVPGIVAVILSFKYLGTFKK